MNAHGEALLAKLISLVIQVGALAFVLRAPTKFALDLQLLGGIWMAQVFPTVIFGLFHPLVQRLGLVRRLGGRHGARHLARLDAASLGAGACDLRIEPCRL